MAKPNVVSLNQCAQIFGITLKTLQGYINKGGCPVVAAGSQGKAAKIDTVAVHEWLKARASGKGSPMAEALLGKAQQEEKRLEIDNKLKMSELYPAEDVYAAFSEALVFLRASMERAAGRLSSGNKVLRTKLLNEHRTILNNFAERLQKYRTPAEREG